jgi:hypothetical protein
MRERRLEISRLDAKRRTPQGGLRIDATPTRTGVLEYSDAAGKTWREYRPAEEVFAPASLETLRGAPVTVGHPDVPVTAENHSELSKGDVRDDVRPDGGLVATTVQVQDAKTVAAVDRGELVELSCGYECDVDPTPGTTPDGERYDAVQRNIRYNHVALGPSGWGRAGSQCALRLDGGARVALPPVARTDSTTTRVGMKKRTVRARLDGKEQTFRLDEMVPPPGASPEDEKRADDGVEALQGVLDGITGQLTDALTALAKAKGELQAKAAIAAATTVPPADGAGEGDTMDPTDEVMDSHVAKRDALRADARLVLGCSAEDVAKIPTKDLADKVIAHVLPGMKLDSLDAKARGEIFAAAVAGAKQAAEKRADATRRVVPLPQRNPALARAAEIVARADSSDGEAADAGPTAMVKSREQQRADARKRAM